MVLVDTSVWLRALANRTPYVAHLDRLLHLDQVAGHQLVYGELLIGDRGGRKKVLSSYSRLRQAEMIPHMDVVAFVLGRGFHDRGVGWIDVHLLASAKVSKMKLWTADASLAALAVDLGIAYRPQD